MRHSSRCFDSILTIIIIVIGISLLVYAPVQAQRETAAKKTFSIINADSVKYSTAEILLEGNVEILVEATSLKLDQLRYDRDQGVGYATGNIKIWQEGFSLVAAELVFYFREDKAVVKKSIEFVRKRESAAGAEVQEERGQMVLLCDELEILLNSKNVAAKGNVKVTEKSIIATGDKLVYRDEEQVVEIEGNVVVMRGEDEQFKASRMTIWLRDETFEGENIQGTIVVTE